MVETVMANANLLARFAQPVRSVQDFEEDYARQDDRAMMRQRNALMLQEGQAVQQDRERTLMEGDTLRNALMAAGPNASLAQRAAAARATGLQSGYKFADDWEKSDAEIGAKRATTGKTVQETQAGAFKLTADKDAQARKLLQVATNPEHASQMIDAAVAKGFWTQEDADLVKRGISQELAQFEQSKLRQLGPALSPDKLLPTTQTRNIGGSTDTLAIDPLTGIPRVTGSVRNTQSPDNRATVGASYANAAAVRDQAQAVRDAAKITTRASDETGLRKEFADLPEVKKFKNAIPAYQSIVKAAKINNPQADINLIYGLAKLYDPDSVVREGEYDTIANSQSIPEWLKGQAQRLAGGGRLTEETKNQIIQQAGIRVSAYESEVTGARDSYDKIARGRGLDPSNVFPAVGGQIAKPSGGMPDMSAIDAEIARRRKGR